jgi:hypothetical protein
VRNLLDVLKCGSSHDWSEPTLMDTSRTQLFKARIYVQVCTGCELCYVMVRDFDPELPSAEVATTEKAATKRRR